LALESVEEVKSPYRTTLAAFSRALTREAHVLTNQPDLLWQQLYNRLQWEGEAVNQALAPELTQRRVPGARPWICLKTPYQESEALVRTLDNHADGASAWVACAFSPDGRFIVSANLDKILQVWEVATGRPLRTLKGHTGTSWACAFSPDGRFIVSGSYDNTLRVWEAATSKLLRTLEGHTGSVDACAFSPDGRFIISGSYDKTLRVWDFNSGEMLACLPFSDSIDSLGLLPSALQMLCVVEGGVAYRLESVGLAYGPIIVTAAKGEQGIEVHCPACQQQIQIKKGSLGCEITCPQEGCGARLRVNPFVIHPPVKIECLPGSQQPVQSGEPAGSRQPAQREKPVVIQQPVQKKVNWLSKLIKK